MTKFKTLPTMADASSLLKARVQPKGVQPTRKAVKAKAGRDAPSLVKLALWCEAHGLTAERERHLARAGAGGEAADHGRGAAGVERVLPLVHGADGPALDLVMSH